MEDEDLRIILHMILHTILHTVYTGTPELKTPKNKLHFKIHKLLKKFMVLTQPEKELAENMYMNYFINYT